MGKHLDNRCRAACNVARVLAQHLGHENGIGVAGLASASGMSARSVRAAVEHMRRDGAHVCAHPQTGYFMATTPEELDRYYIRHLKARALTSLIQISRATKISLPDLFGQLHLPT